MPKKQINSLYKTALNNKQLDLERISALEALTAYDNLEVTVGEFIAQLKTDKTWGPFSTLSLAEFVTALNPGLPKGGRRVGRPSSKKTVPKGAPTRLNKKVSAKYTADIETFLGTHPGSKCAEIAGAIGLTSKQTASLLRKLRAAKGVTVTGQKAAMVYTLGSEPSGPTKKKAPKPIAPARPRAKRKPRKK